jgi:hypothetical protein
MAFKMNRLSGLGNQAVALRTMSAQGRKWGDSPRFL